MPVGHHCRCPGLYPFMLITKVTRCSSWGPMNISTPNPTGPLQTNCPSTLWLRQDGQRQAFFQCFPTVPNQPEVSSCCEPGPPARQNEYAYMLICIVYNLHDNRRPILPLRSGFQRQLRSTLKAAWGGTVETLHPRAPSRLAFSLEFYTGRETQGPGRPG